MYIVLPFSISLSVDMVLSQPLPWPTSLTLPDVCHTLFLLKWTSYLEQLKMKRRRFPCLLSSVGGGGGDGEIQQLVYFHPWLFASR